MASHSKSVADLYREHESFREQAKDLYDKADATLKKLVRAWKKNKRAEIEQGKVLEIEDQFRGATKAFAPGFAHRYKLKLRTLESAD
jgi:lipopolysaccharide biosynthesis regulator YciM